MLPDLEFFHQLCRPIPAEVLNRQQFSNSGLSTCY